MNLKKKFVIGAASLALVAGMGVAPAMAANEKIIKLPNGYSVNLDTQRLAGVDRVETSLAAAKAQWKDNEASVKTIYVVGYDGLVDAATAGMIDNNPSLAGPVVSLPTNLSAQKLLGVDLKKTFPNATKIVAIGGTNVVSDEALKGIADYSEIPLTDRWGGKTRYETNITVVSKVFATPQRAYLTRGDNVVDALTAGTLHNGPVILVPQAGDVPQVTKDYVKSANLSEGNVVVIGGTGALSDEQAGKVFPSAKTIDTTPWTAPEILAGLKDKVRTAAILYLGQKDWQEQADSLGLSSEDANKPYDELNYSVLSAKTFFGLAASNTQVNAVEDRSKINSDAAINGADKDAFRGYYAVNEEVKKAKAKLDASDSILKLTQAIDTAETTAVQEDIAAEEFTAAKVNGGQQAQVKALVDALNAVYGSDVIKENLVEATQDGKGIANSGVFKFSPANGSSKAADANKAVFTGLNRDALNGLVAAAKKSADKVLNAKENGNTWTETDPNATLAQAAKGDENAMTAVLTINKPANGGAQAVVNKHVNLLALQELVNARAKQANDDVVGARKGLIDAVRTWYSANDKDGSTKSSSGTMYRLAGADRYETSAYVSVFQSKDQNARPFGGEGRSAMMKAQYLASGDDAHLIDSVFAGQMTKGTILLVPATGEVNSLVATELKRKGTKLSKGGEGIFPADTFAIGGKTAVSDEVFTAAMNALGSK
ncbi:hypothetical protein HHJ71_09175 [Mobiluncus curtisii]|uniref:cell wall-binding repeat-containing protein n=1 Tax=Mobiluncus curtisii TaxID=2051 RepID=UPI0014703C84|nr:cell wall-binding repeat-containing protein [Mobiluncus curtisii]NMX00107.1 hypothetical protein [Mobiluncus curtisii]